MSLRLIGAGVGRTGTHSLKLACERLLGEPCYHMVEVFSHPGDAERWTAAARGQPVDWHQLFDGWGATVDWPSAAFWPEIAQAFPEAVILLSTRDPQSWWGSASTTIFAGGGPGRPGFTEMFEALFEQRFTPRFQERDEAIAAYERHVAHVRATAPADRLVEWAATDGWGPLCSALGVPVPDAPFPKSNTGEEFRVRVGTGP